MKALLLIILISFSQKAYSERICLIAVSTNDCSVCQVSYNYINKINRNLNPKIILSSKDSISANYFIREYLHIKDIEYIIDDSKYNSLIKDKFSLQIQLFDDSKIIFQLPIKDLSFRINELNGYVNKNNYFTSKDYHTNDTIFSTKVLDSIYFVLKKRFVGTTQRFIVKDEIVFYSELTRWIICSNLRTGKTINLRLEDSLLYDKLGIIFDNKKRKFYKDNVENLAETQITSFCYYEDKLYLALNVIDYSKMKSEKDLTPTNNEVELIFMKFIAKYDISEGKLTLVKKLDLTDENLKYDIRYGFSIYNDKPVLYLKKSLNKKDSFYAIDLSANWSLKNIKQSRTDLMSEHILENVFYNHITYNYDSYTLINNSTGKYKKLFPETMLTTLKLSGGSILINGDDLFMSVLNRGNKKHMIYRISLTSGSVSQLKELIEPNIYDFYPFFYLDNHTNKLRVFDIDDDFKLILQCEIQL